MKVFYFFDSSLFNKTTRKKLKREKEILDIKINNNEQYSIHEMESRGNLIEEVTREMTALGITNDNIFSIEGKLGVFTEERKVKHREILDMFHKRFKDVPCEKKAWFTGGIPGSGKTTYLNSHSSKVDLENYVFISCDDFQLEFAKRGMIPKVDGIFPLELVTLSHSEALYLTETFFHECSKLGKNLIYDSTFRNREGMLKKIERLNSYGYKYNDIKIVFVKTTVEKAKSRTMSRYKEGLYELDNLGSRYMPGHVFSLYLNRNGSYATINEENIFSIYEELKSKGLNPPLVIENSKDFN